MSIQSALENAFRSLLYNKKRSILTMIGIIIGISSVITILSLGRGFEIYAVENLTQTNSKNITFDISFFPTDDTLNGNFFSEQDLNLVESVEGVDKVEYVKGSSNTLYKDLLINNTKYSTSISLIKKQSRSVDYGRMIDSIDIMSNHKVAVVDSNVAQLFSANSIEFAVGKGIEIDNTIYQIIGIVNAESENLFSDSASIEIPKNTYEFYNQDITSSSNIRVFISEDNKPSTVNNYVLKILTDYGTLTSQGTYESFDMNQVTDGIGKILSVLTIFITSIASISLLIAGVSVTNMMYTSVSERIQEIGVRRAVGARQKDIRNQFLIEGLLLTISSGIIGYIIGLLLAILISLTLPFKVRPDLFTISLSIGITSILGILFSLAPANSAAKKDLVTILR